MPILDLLAPVACVACGAGSDGELCASCATSLGPVLPPLCARCGAPAQEQCRACVSLRGFTRARSLVRYEGPARRLILALKRRGRPGLAREMGELLAALAAAHGLVRGAVACVPAGRRGAVKGFDHGELLARAVAGTLGCPFGQWLVRTADAGRQSDSRAPDRRANAAASFRARGRVPAEVLLVDDILTTGATAEACAEQLVRRGARRVDVVTFARTVKSIAA